MARSLPCSRVADRPCFGERVVNKDPMPLLAILAGGALVVATGVVILKASIWLAERLHQAFDPPKPKPKPQPPQDLTVGKGYAEVLWAAAPEPVELPPVQMPSAGLAIGIVIAIVATQVYVMAVGRAFALVADLGIDDAHQHGVTLVEQLIDIPVGFLATSLLLTAMLPTTLHRALLIAAIPYSITLVIVATVGAAGLVILQ